MRKHFVLSTRTLVSKRNVTQSFGSDNTIYVPICVMEEMERKYSDQISERGRIARDTLAYLGSFNIKELQRGVVQENGSILKVVVNYNKETLSNAVANTDLDKLDERILKTCLGIRKDAPDDEQVILVSKKSTLRKKAELLGIKAQTFRDELLPEISEQYTGRKKLMLDDQKIKEFREKKKIALNSIFSPEEENEFYPNMFIEMKGKSDWALGRVSDGYIVALNYEFYHPYGVIPKNAGQKFMIEALMSGEDEATLVIFKGPAGTAKTFMALAAGLEHVEEYQHFSNKILYSRSPTETGEKIGFLPGSEIDKIAPYLRGAMDNLANLHTKSNDESIIETKNFTKKSKRDASYEEKPTEENGTIFFERGEIKSEAIGYIRGRSICDTYIIIDEAQNLSPGEIKTIITRVGTGTKLILLGDPAQIDRPELDERNNGLSYASERLKGEKNCWQITMEDEESVRSELAKRASILL